MLVKSAELLVVSFRIVPMVNVDTISLLKYVIVSGVGAHKLVTLGMHHENHQPEWINNMLKNYKYFSVLLKGLCFNHTSNIYMMNSRQMLVNHDKLI